MVLVQRNAFREGRKEKVVKNGSSIVTKSLPISLTKW